jgi:hypothetical protein
MDRHPYLVFIHYFFHSPIVTLLIDSSTCWNFTLDIN